MSRATELINDLRSFSGDYFGLLARQKEAVDLAKALSTPEQVAFVLLGVELLSSGSVPGDLINKAVVAVLRKKLPFTDAQVHRLVELGESPTYYFPFAQVLTLAASIGMTAELARSLRAMQNCRVLRGGQVTGHAALRERIDEMLAGPRLVKQFEPFGPWSRAIAGEVTSSWRPVLEAGADITGSEPTKKWREAAAARVERIGREEFRVVALRWLALGPSPGVTDLPLDSKENDYLRGLLWSLSSFSDEEMCALVARFAEQCLRKIPMIGPVSQRAGNACVNVLRAMESLAAVSQLARLAIRIKYHTAQRLVQEALEEAAKRQGMSRDELEEITVPTFGLDTDGCRTEQFGEYTAHLSIRDGLIWRNAEGKPVKSTPEAARRDFAEDLKELKQAAKEMDGMLGAHRVRIERLMLSGREIPAATWASAYIDHPLMASFARRLIWQMSSSETAIWSGGRLLGWNGSEVAVSERVRLWHPLLSDVQTVLSWRCWLEDHQVQQPFKQAHREVYVLTDAERDTSTYSNRFAGHVLKQHQFAALCEQRGWKFRLMGEWDSHNTPTLELPAFGLNVEYHVDFPQDTSVSGHMVYLYLATDQVRFVDPATYLPRALETVSPVLFSEVMRDIDLFVGVSSVGSDPTWLQSENAPFGHYWNEFSFGELSASGEQRKQILEALLPKLSIRDRCRLEDRYLWVRGDRATYKIHLGSGSVLIEPGSRYLCIVRGPSSGVTPSKVFLPFEGDGILSLILSKAITLANDTSIKDPHIVRQLP